MSLEKCGNGRIRGGMLVERMRMERAFSLKNSDKMKVRKWPAWKKIYPDSLGGHHEQEIRPILEIEVLLRGRVCRRVCREKAQSCISSGWAAYARQAP